MCDSSDDMEFLGEEAPRVEDPMAAFVDAALCDVSSVDSDLCPSDDASDASTPRSTGAAAVGGKKPPRAPKALPHGVVVRIGEELDRAAEAVDEAMPQLTRSPYVAAPPQSSTAVCSVPGVGRLRSQLAAERSVVAAALLPHDAAGLPCRGPDVRRRDPSTMAPEAVAAEAEAAQRQMRSSNAAALCATAALAVRNGGHLVSVMQRIPVRGGRRHVDLDVASDSGLRWFKVRAGGPAGMAQGLRRGGDIAGSVVEAAVLLAEAAAAPPLQPPFGLAVEPVLVFREPPPRDLAAAVLEQAPTVRLATVVEALALPPRPLPVRAVNFDVTAMVALCSDLSHTDGRVQFPANPVLDRQAADEASGNASLADYLAPALRLFTTWGPAPPATETAASTVPAAELTADLASEEAVAAVRALQELGPDMGAWPQNWLVCRTALKEFRWIVDTISGPGERARAEWLYHRLAVVEDAAFGQPPPVCGLQESRRVQGRHLAVFGAGDRERAVTLSANRMFVQAALEQGVAVAVAHHPARALTERKRRGLQDKQAPLRGHRHPASKAQLDARAAMGSDVHDPG